MSEHFRSECPHGVVVSQCRCPSPNKHITIVPCPPECPDRPQADPDYGRVCEHGRLARQCGSCELVEAEARIAELEAEVKRLRAAGQECYEYLHLNCTPKAHGVACIPWQRVYRREEVSDE